MINIIIFILTSFGLANAIVNESIFNKFRLFIDKNFHYSFVNKVIKCITCTGFYTGMILYFLLPIDTQIIFKIIIAGLFSSGIIKIISIKLFKL